MNRPLQFPVVTAFLTQLARRVRWKRWLVRLTRFAWLVASMILGIYAADLLYGLNTGVLRIASGVLVLGAISILLFDFWQAWFSRLDPVGVAQLAEKQSPDLAERLITLVQIQRDLPPAVDPEFVYLLGIDTEKQLASISTAAGCPLGREGRFLAATAVVLAALFGGLGCEPSFDLFSQRFVTAWNAPDEPFVIRLVASENYGGAVERIECDGRVIELARLDRHVYSFAAHCLMVDQRAKKPAECWLVCADAAGGHERILMAPLRATSAGEFTCEISNPRQSRSYWAEADGVRSRSLLVAPIERPEFTDGPTVVVSAPRYANQPASMPIALGPQADALDLLRFSRMRLDFALSREATAAWLRIKKLPSSEQEQTEQSMVPVNFQGDDRRGGADIIASQPGSFQAELIVEIGPNLCAVLPVGTWTVHDDLPPRFVEPIRVAGAGNVLKGPGDHKIAQEASLKLQMIVEDGEGLDAIALEFRVNDGPTRVQTWKRAAGKKVLAIDDWLPLPAGLKDGDRVQFRLLATDRRRLQKGEIVQTNQQMLPAEDLAAQVTAWPAALGAEPRWITLLVDRSAGGLFEEQVRAQADEVRDRVAKIRQKLLSEDQQLEKLQRTIHQQAAVSPEQMQNADRIRRLNREVTEDLLRAGEYFMASIELARLADRFFDIAETEMLQSAASLNRFSTKDRPLAGAQKDLRSSQDAVQQALKKLDRMNDLNKLLAQDRIDQWQIEKLAHRQELLAQQLKNLLENVPLSDAELARQIEAIRHEQARLAEERGELEKQNALVKESAEALAQQALPRLVKMAEQLAAEQRKMHQPESGKMLSEKADKLAADLKELAQKAAGPEAKAMAKESAEALEQAKKAMTASDAAKAKGDAETAKIADDEAAGKLDLVVKQLAKLAQDQAMKQSGKDGAEKVAEALKDSGTRMKTAQDKLPASPKDAQIAMKGAAQKLAEAAQLAQRQASRRLPKLGRDPAAKTIVPLGGAGPGAVSNNAKFEAFQGKNWGELPGELKTRLMQDFRSRFGEEYADLIQQYFERLAEMPPRKQ